MPDIRLANISEFQSSIDAPAYLAAGHRCLIVRAHSGYRPDKLWRERRDYLRGFPFAALGFYQYIVPGRDAAEQAHDFIATVGPLRSNEFPVGDLEEGLGSQTARAEQWLRNVDRWCGFPATLYSGEAFFAGHLGGLDRWKGRPRWVAAYRATEPAAAHELWQSTDAARFLGIAGTCDGNLYHGTDERFARTFCAPAISAPAGAVALQAARMPDGGQEVFAELASGEVVHRWNASGGGWVPAWHSLGTPGAER